MLGKPFLGIFPIQDEDENRQEGIMHAIATDGRGGDWDVDQFISSQI